MLPLVSITISNDSIPASFSKEDERSFLLEKKFVAELYHDRLHSYRPPKTAEIRVNFSGNPECLKPSLWRSICWCYIYVDLINYSSLNKRDKYLLILNSLHNALMQAVGEFGWERTAFELAYLEVKESNFLFIKEFPIKRSPDRKKTGQAILEKTETRSIVKFRILGTDLDEATTIIEKMNSYPLDASLSIARKSKWIDNDKFGYQDLKTSATIFYNAFTKKRYKNIAFWEDKFEADLKASS